MNNFGVCRLSIRSNVLTGGFTGRSTSGIFSRILFGLLYGTVFTLFSPGSSVADDTAALSLSDCYQLALTQSESLQRKGEDVKAAEARYREALSAIYPNLHAGATQRVRDGNSSSGGSSSVDFTSTGSSAQGKHPFQTSLTLTQPIFTGFRDFYLIQASEFEIQASKFDQTRSAELLYQDTADIFHQVVYFEKVLKLFQKTDRVISQRINDLRRFVDLGKSRTSEIEAAEADKADLGAATAQTSGLLDATKEMLAFLIGRPVAEIRLNPASAPVEPKPLDDLLSQGRERADIHAEKQRVAGASKELIASTRERWPVISFVGNAYPYSDPDDNRIWDMLVKLDVPIFEGGGIDARIEQSRVKERNAQLSAQEIARVADREIRVAYSDVRASREEVDRLKTLLNATKKSYESQRRDYELGVVTNLDVLAAIRDVQNAERRLLEAETSVQRNLVRLQVAAGSLQ